MNLRKEIGVTLTTFSRNLAGVNVVVLNTPSGQCGLDGLVNDTLECIPVPAGVLAFHV